MYAKPDDLKLWPLRRPSVSRYVDLGLVDDGRVDVGLDVVVVIDVQAKPAFSVVRMSFADSALRLDVLRPLRNDWADWRLFASYGERQ